MDAEAKNARNFTSKRTTQKENAVLSNNTVHLQMGGESREVWLLRLSSFTCYIYVSKVK